MPPALVPIVRTVARQAGSGHLQRDNDLAVHVGDAESELVVVEEDVDDDEGKQVGDEDNKNMDDVNLHLGGHDAPLVLPLVDDPRAGARAQAGQVERAADLRRTMMMIILII